MLGKPPYEYDQVYVQMGDKIIGNPHVPDMVQLLSTEYGIFFSF